MNNKKKTIASLLLGLLSAAAIAQSTPYTEFTYDANNQTTSVTSPRGITQNIQRNRFGLPTQYTWPNVGSGTASGPVGVGYNGQNEVTSVSDPRGLQTTYNKDGFGETQSQVSPDTASTLFSRDSNGNVLSRTTVAGQVESYTYGPTNRVASKTVTTSAGQSLTWSFNYGAPGAGVEAGQLTSITAPGQQTAYAHDLHGRLTSVTQTVGSQTFTVSYSYTNGKLATVTYPSGRVLTYARNANGQISGITVTQSGVTTPLLSNITYNPVGAINGWQFGNGTPVSRPHDLNGRLSSVSMPQGTRAYTYDDDDRIVAIDDPVLGSATYGYDNLNRLTNATTALGTWAYQYDANGNRTNYVAAGQSYPFTVSATSNRTTAVAGPVAQDITFTTDGQTSSVQGGSSLSACGNPLQLTTAADGQVVQSNGYSAVMSAGGQRLQKTSAACAGGAVANFVYGPGGVLLGEYDGTSNTLQETVWLGGIPVAVFTPASTAANYVWADNLGSPRAITNAAGQLLWQWDGEPYGATPANSNPAGLGAFTYNLRFPGQYFDVETGYHHNGWREYDPSVGKYVQSDPIGLAGGLNTYGYVKGQPLSLADENGRCPLCLTAINAGIRAWQASKVIRASTIIGTSTIAQLGLTALDDVPGLGLGSTHSSVMANQVAREFLDKTYSGIRNWVRLPQCDTVGLRHLRYADGSRPGYSPGLVQEVWLRAKSPLDGVVRDPNTLKDISWSPGASRVGVWDMGHVPGEEYSKLYKDYEEGRVSINEFKAKYNNPVNYRPELPSQNRSHVYELK